MLTTDLNDLATVVERIRSEVHPNLDPKFVTAVLALEADAAGSDGVALQALRLAVEAALGEGCA